MLLKYKEDDMFVKMHEVMGKVMLSQPNST
jgi:hypothetical protein